MKKFVSRYKRRYRILYISQQRVSDKLRTPGLKRKLKTHTTETKLQATADEKRGVESKAIAKKYEITQNPVNMDKECPKDQRCPWASIFGSQRKKMWTNDALSFIVK